MYMYTVSPALPVRNFSFRRTVFILFILVTYKCLLGWLFIDNIVIKLKIIINAEFPFKSQDRAWSISLVAK